MIITWHGESCFKIQSGEQSILIDLPSKESGLTAPRFKVDAILKTSQELPLPFEKSETPLIVGPGEYEVNGIVIDGYQLLKDSDEKIIKTIYRVVFDEIKLVFLGEISKLPEAKELEGVMGADILFIPGDGSPHIDIEGATKLIKQLKAKIVIPTLLKTPGLKRKAGDGKEFLKEIGQNPASIEKLVIKKKDIGEKLQVVVLKV